MQSQDARYWADKDAEAGESEEEASGSGSGEEEEDDSTEGNDRGARATGSLPAWPQSYRQSMDMYSSLQSPSLSIFSPGLHHRTSHLSSSYQRLPQDAPTYTGSQPLKIPFLPGRFPGKAEQYLPVSDVVRKPEDGGEKSEAEYEADAAIPHESSFLQGLFNGINILAGVGVLSTPYALKEAGWLGLLLLFLLSIICLYTGILLRRCLESAPGLATYPDIGQAAFGNIGRIIISIILYTELYACCVEFLILEGDNLSALFPGAQFTVAGIDFSSNTFFACLTALCVLPTVWLRDLSYLAYVSASKFSREPFKPRSVSIALCVSLIISMQASYNFCAESFEKTRYIAEKLKNAVGIVITGGVLASIIVGVAVFWVGEFDGVGFLEGGPLFNWAGLPVSIGLYGFCYSGHAVFPNIYSSLRNRNDFNKVLGVSFLLCTLLYGGVAVMGFTMFGQNTASQITLNLPKQFMASKIAVWTTVVNPFTKFALTMTPVALSLEELLPLSPNSLKHRSSSILIRTVLVASTICVAVMVPFFGYVMAFIGSFLSMTVSVILPCAIYLTIFSKKVSFVQAVLCWIVMLIGFVCLVGGTYSSISGIIASYSPPHQLVL